MLKETFENRTTKRILTGAAAAAILASVGIRSEQLNKADELGRAQQRADHPSSPNAQPGIPGFNVSHGGEKDR